MFCTKTAQKQHADDVACNGFTQLENRSVAELGAANRLKSLCVSTHEVYLLPKTEKKRLVNQRFSTIFVND
jgi:hypothetical protein